jgi:hypothetical protein
MNRGIKLRVYLFLKLPVSTILKELIISIHYFIDIKYKMEDDSSWQRLQDENSWLKARNEGLLA